MSKKTQNKKNSKTKNTNISTLFALRNGGQIALSGYSYQFIYSCNLILSSYNNYQTVFTLEGIEDIDTIEYGTYGNNITHIQLKYSKKRQDASFMDNILKNFLQIYLIDPNRNFKLVYDFDVADGYLNKLISGHLDEISTNFWKKKIDEIKNRELLWNWNNFNFNDFISKLSFENVKKSFLENNIENLLIKNYNISIDNIILYINSIKMLCFDKMITRGNFIYEDVKHCIEKTKFEISKGTQNPAHSWIQKIQFLKTDEHTSDYYEGKKATSADIANDLPTERPIIEQEIINSIQNNTITIIKASSGQGKTTLAFRAIMKLQNEYTPYQISCCNKDSELGNIVEYFQMRTKIGEKILILFDNLDAHLCEWNSFAQLMQSNVIHHYKILITSREDDWYNYGGDLSNLHSLKIIKPTLNANEAEAIFNSLKKSKKISSNITNWYKPWIKISNRQLLIEYVYLITHGTMLSERISSQMKEIGNTPLGKIKTEILRNVCLADICGIKLETKILIKNLKIPSNYDIGEIIKSLTNEFLLHISTDGNYIEGLHPVRSKHIVNYLHEYVPIDQTALSVSKIASISDVSTLFSHYPELDLDKKTFYSDIIDTFWDPRDLSYFVYAIRGTFSGSVMQYFCKNKKLFDEAQKHGGLSLIALDLCPFATIKEFNQELCLLENLFKIFPQNANIQYLVKLRDSIPKFETHETDIYYINLALYNKLNNIKINDIIDIESYAIIVDWLYNMDNFMNLSLNINLDYLWNNRNKYSIDSISSLFYSSYCGNKLEYNNFVKNNLLSILDYIKQKTNSHVINLINNKIVKIKYILKPSEVSHANYESVSRLKIICRTLPIFEMYCSDAIKPEIDILKAYNIPDDAHKEMPINNIVKMFHEDFNSIWINTIESNYEFDTIDDWMIFWLKARKCICNLLCECCLCMYKILEGRKIGKTLFCNLYIKYNEMIVSHNSYPHENRPFDSMPEAPNTFIKYKNEYFNCINNFAGNFLNFIMRKKESYDLILYNLKNALSYLNEMQIFFSNIIVTTHQTDHTKLCLEEEKIILNTYMCCQYYIHHFASKQFNKYQVKAWFNNLQKTKIEKINSEIKSFEIPYNVLLPDQIYYKKSFSYYPILLKDAIQNIEGFLIYLVKLKKIPYDFLVLLFQNKYNEVNNQALCFSKNYFTKFHEIMLSKEEIPTNSNLMPYIVEVNEKMLKCFSENLILQNTKSKTNLQKHLIDIGEELWIYSKNRELLTQSSDEQYLCKNLDIVKNNINRIVKEPEILSDYTVQSYINVLCKKVYDGQSFDNKEYNELISYVQNLNIK